MQMRETQTCCGKLRTRVEYLESDPKQLSLIGFRAAPGTGSTNNDGKPGYGSRHPGLISALKVTSVRSKSKSGRGRAMVLQRGKSGKPILAFTCA